MSDRELLMRTLGRLSLEATPPQVDALLEEARAEQDADKRIALYDKIVATLKDDACIIPCYFETYLAASTSKLQGFQLQSNTHINRWYGLYFN